jgi:hypothetical protein
MRCLASPYDEGGDAFVMHEGEGGASAVWTGQLRPLGALESRAKPLDAPGGGGRAPRVTDTPT